MSTTHEETAPMTSSTPKPRRTFLGTLRFAYGSVLAQVYLGVCVALSVWAVIETPGDGPDASMAGVVPVLATAPFSLVMLVLPDHTSMIFVAVAFGALVNAFVLGWCARVLLRGISGSRPSA